MSAKVSHYILFFDTNALRGEYYVHNDLASTLKQLTEARVVKINLTLPEVVKDEWCQNFFAHAERHQKQISKATKELVDMGLLLNTFNKQNESVLLETGVKYLQNLGFAFIDTPYTTIDFLELTKRAVRHVPPFEEESDKGYKDGLIALTIKHWLDNTTLKPSQQVVLTTNDKRLTTYVRELIPDDKILHVCETLVDLKNYIELSVNELSNQLADEASDLFFALPNNQSLFEKQELGHELGVFYDSFFPDSKVARKHLESMYYTNNTPFIGSAPIGDAYEFGERKFQPGSTSFVERNKNKLTWISGVTLIQDYLLSSSSMNTLPINSPQSINHNVFFEYIWTTDLVNGKLTNPHLVKQIPRSEYKTANVFTSHWSSVAAFSPSYPTIDGGTGLQTISGMPSLRSPFKPNSNFIGTTLDITGNKVSALNSLLGINDNTNKKFFWEETTSE